MEEIDRAIRTLKDDKSPGPDGLPIDFYKANINWICDDLLEVYEEDISQGSLGTDIRKGVIKLLSNDGNKSMINNW